jgi:NAD(P)H-dependent flavin oxidoreductase YrpB (nitropropane dioxygenase family)
MLHTRVCDLFGVSHPVVLGGMGSGTNPALVSAVSNAGGLGVQGCAGRTPDEIAQLADAIRGATHKPFGLNLLLFMANDEHIQAVLQAKPPIFSSAWPWPETNLRSIFKRAHDRVRVCCTWFRVSTKLDVQPRRARMSSSPRAPKVADTSG